MKTESVRLALFKALLKNVLVLNREDVKFRAENRQAVNEILSLGKLRKWDKRGPAQRASETA